MNNNNVSSRTRELVLTALMIALVFLAGTIIKVPTVGGFVHIGDCMVFLSVVVLGKKRGTLASAIGMGLVDILGGYYMWAPFTIVIKGVMAYIAGAIIENLGNDDNKGILKKEYIIAFIISGVFMVLGYFIAGAILAGFLTENLGLMEGLLVASKDIITNIIQVTTGIILAIPLSTVLKSVKEMVFN